MEVKMGDSTEKQARPSFFKGVKAAVNAAVVVKIGAEELPQVYRAAVEVGEEAEHEGEALGGVFGEEQLHMRTPRRRVIHIFFAGGVVVEIFCHLPEKGIEKIGRNDTLQKLADLRIGDDEL